MEDKGSTAIVAVPFDAVLDLENQGLATSFPVFRGAIVDAVVSVGMDSAALVTLIQTPDSARAFAAWIRNRCARSGDTIEISATRGKRRIQVKADGDIDVGVVANFLMAAFADHEPKP